MTTTSPAAKDRAATLGAVKTLVQKQMINAGRVDLDQWAIEVDRKTPDLLSADDQEFEAGVRELLARLHVSHTAFYKSLPDRFPPQHTISATLRKLGHNGTTQWMFLDVFDNGPAHVAGIRPGDILKHLDGHEVSSSSVPAFGIGRQHRLTVATVDGQRRREVTVDVPLRKGSKVNPPIVEPMTLKASLVDSSMGLLKVGWFPGAIGLAFAKQLDDVIAELKSQGMDRLIIDLRGNIGGGLGFARLASYFCSESIPIGQSVTPQRLRSGSLDELPRVPMPATKWELVSTFSRFMVKDKSLVLLTQRLGEQPFHGRIVILTNEWTNSAAEMVANFAAENQLATIVGLKTAGNVLGARNFKVGRSYWLRIPIFGWLTSKGESLDGVGLLPQIVVDVDPVSLNAGRDEQLDRARQILK